MVPQASAPDLYRDWTTPTLVARLFFLAAWEADLDAGCLVPDEHAGYSRLAIDFFATNIRAALRRREHEGVTA